MTHAKDFKPLNPGGTAEKHPHMPVSKAEVQAGIPVEKEHTTSTEKAQAIAVDHVVEIPDYYKRLEKLEAKADAEGAKRAALLPEHQAIMDDATQRANNELQRAKILGEMGAGVAGVATSIPAIGLILPGIGEFRNDARAALEAKAQRHADELALLHHHLQSGKIAAETDQDTTGMGAAPRGDELHLPLGSNPHMGDPAASSEYENGFDYAQALGHQALNQATEGDVARWAGGNPAWREGFASACEKFGLSRVGNLVLSPPKTAAVPSALEPAGHWSRGLGALAGAGAGIAAHSMWGDTGELYTLAPALLGGIAGGTIVGDLGHSVSQQGSVNPDTPIRGTDDPRVRTPQALAALAGTALGAGLGYVGGHEFPENVQGILPDSWQGMANGNAPEIIGTSVGGVAGGIAGSVLEDRLAGRGKRAHYTLLTEEDPMTCIAPMTEDALKTAGGWAAPLVGALGGAAGGAMLGEHVPQLTDFIQQHHQGAEIPGTGLPAVPEQTNWFGGTDPGSPAIPAEHAQLAPEELARLHQYYGAGIGGGLGLAGGALAGAGHRQPGMYRTADAKLAALTDIDSDLEGSALEAIQSKIAGLGTTMGTLGGIAGGALLGNYLTPAMHWAVTPGEHAALGHVAQEQLVDPALAQVNPDAGQADQAAAAAKLHEHIQQLQDPGYLHGLQAGAEGSRGAQWDSVANIGQITGAGVGGIAGYQAGRGMDQALGLERRERPLVISPMAQHHGY